MKHVTKRFFAVYYANADDNSPDYDVGNEADRKRAYIQFKKKEDLGSLNPNAVRKAIEKYREELGKELDEYLSRTSSQSLKEKSDQKQKDE